MEWSAPGSASSRKDITVIDLGQDGGADNLGFYDSAALVNNPVSFFDAAAASRSQDQLAGGYDVSGEMPNVSSATSRQSGGGVAGRFLDSKGFGWLLETEDDDIDYSTPLLEELDIDVKDIYYKVRCVLLPLPYFRLRLGIVRDSPDFWGPLLVVLSYALVSLYGQLSVVSWLATIWFAGSFQVFFLARALGGDVSYSQVLGVIGYCLLPLVVTAIPTSLLAPYPLCRFLLGCFGVAWAVYSSGTLLCRDEQLQEKRVLLLYPVFLLYVYCLSLHSGV